MYVTPEALHDSLVVFLLTVSTEPQISTLSMFVSLPPCVLPTHPPFRTINPISTPKNMSPAQPDISLLWPYLQAGLQRHSISLNVQQGLEG